MVLLERLIARYLTLCGSLTMLVRSLPRTVAASALTSGELVSRSCTGEVSMAAGASFSHCVRS